MPYGVGGAIAEGLQSGFEMGRSVTQDAERRREFEIEQAVRKENADRLWQQEKDRYSRMADEAQVKAQQEHLAMLDKLAKGYEDRGEPVDPRLNEMRAQASARLSQMHQSIATSGRLAPVGGVQAPERPNVASAAPLPDLSQAPPAAPSGAAGGPQANPAPASGGVGATAAPPVQSPPARGLGPSYGPAGMGVDGLQPASASTPLPATAAAPPAPAIPGGAPQAATVASPTTSAVTPQQQFVTQADQSAQDLASRLNTGQVSLADVAPKDFALMVASATKHDASDLSALNQGIADFHAGMQTGNNGLVIQGLNGIFGPQINQGAGQPSAYGGNVVSKKIIGLDPAASADGTIHPDRVMPRLEVTTDQTGPDGTPLIYHAPLLGADGKVAAIPLADAMNHIGAQGALAATLSHPDAQALLAKGARDPEVQKYLDYYNQQATPLSKTQVLENRIRAFMTKNNVDRATAEQAFRNSGEIPWQLSIPRGVGGGDVAAAEQLFQDHPDQYKTIGDALNAVRATSHAYSKYGPGAVNVGPAGSAGGVQGNGVTAANAGLTGDDYLKTLPTSMQATVKNIAANPSLLQNVPTAKGARAAMADRVLQYKPDAQLGKDAGGMGSREAVFINRTLTSANEAAKDLENIASLPIKASSGIFGSAHPGTTMLTAPMTVLGNKMTSQDVQTYNVMATGFHRSLAGIESAGLAPSGQLSNQMDSVIFKEGDTELTKLQKLAQTRQIVEAGLETVLANPKLAPSQRDHVNAIIASVRKAVPFSQQDIIRLQTKWNDDPSATLSSVMKRVPTAAPPAPAGAAPAWTDKDEARLRELEAKHGAH